MCSSFETEAAERAVVEDHPLARLYRTVRGWRIAEGTTEILRLSIARGRLARHRASRAQAGDETDGAAAGMV